MPKPVMPLAEQAIDTWNIHSRIVIYLLDTIPPSALHDSYSQRGRNVGQIFAHIHNNRLAWLGMEESNPELMNGLAKIDKDQATDKPLFKRSLNASARAVEKLLQEGIVRGKVRGFNPHAVAFLGYLISHEAYHHGEIGLTLAQAGHPLDKRDAYEIWEWHKR